MTVRAVGEVGESPSDIFGVRDHLEVFRIDAGSNPAEMIKLAVIWDRSLREREDESMESDELTFPPDEPVSVRERARPENAFI